MSLPEIVYSSDCLGALADFANNCSNSTNDIARALGSSMQVVVCTVQAQQTLILSLETRIAELEGKINE